MLANKKPLSDTQALYDELLAPSHQHCVQFESACGAGTPFIAAVRRLSHAGDSITRMSGCFSGTLGFITTQLGPATPISSLLGEAVRLGYTEPDPRDDLGGLDVARKALILARLTGSVVDMHRDRDS